FRPSVRRRHQGGWHLRNQSPGRLRAPPRRLARGGQLSRRRPEGADDRTTQGERNENRGLQAQEVTRLRELVSDGSGVATLRTRSVPAPWSQPWRSNSSSLK